jgi:hypothetical protein
MASCLNRLVSLGQPSRPAHIGPPLFFILPTEPAAPPHLTPLAPCHATTSHRLCRAPHHAPHRPPIGIRIKGGEIKAGIQNLKWKIDFDMETDESLIVCATGCRHNLPCVRASPSPYKTDHSGHLNTFSPLHRPQALAARRCTVSPRSDLVRLVTEEEKTPLPPPEGELKPEVHHTDPSTTPKFREESSPP